MDKVASVDVDQSILGRMLDYGTVHVIGTGGVQCRSRRGARHRASARIAQPLALRNAITANQNSQRRVSAAAGLRDARARPRDDAVDALALLVEAGEQRRRRARGRAAA